MGFGWRDQILISANAIPCWILVFTCRREVITFYMWIWRMLMSWKILSNCVKGVWPAFNNDHFSLFPSSRQSNCFYKSSANQSVKFNLVSFVCWQCIGWNVRYGGVDEISSNTSHSNDLFFREQFPTSST